MMSPARPRALVRGLWLAGSLFVGASACEEEAPPPPAATAAKKPAPAPAKPKEADKAKDKDSDAPKLEYSYSPVGKRDPFRSYIADMRDLAKQDEDRRPESTEKFELDQYRLTGIISGTSQPQAMVEDPEQIGHVLRIGSRLGKNGGRITRIGVSEIVITEEFRAPTGERVRVPITLRLPQPEELLSESVK
jgi:type IV pilus assembly protein PilP